jgi:catechol 2,3-dioxygenase-like lactoylglutathione lyase family enzyme
MLGEDLAYVALVVRDLEAASAVFGKHLGMPRAEMDADGDKLPVFSIGQSALALFPVGHAYVDGFDKPGVHHIALGASRLEPAVAEAKAAGAASIGVERASLNGGRRIALDPQGTASIKTWISTPLKLAPSQSPHVERIDHLGIASADNRRSVEAWTGRIGRPLESQQTDMEVSIAVESFTSDKYGVVYHTRAPEPIGGLRVSFITVGDCELEFLQNFDPRHSGYVGASQAGTTRQDQGAITKFIAARGEGLHHVAFKTKDINATLSMLDKAGVSVIDRVGRPGSRRGLIGFVHPQSVGGVLVHFVQRD